MNLDQLGHKLIKVARMTPADDRVPYAFEKRVLARLKACTPLDIWSFWAHALWRATAPCVAVALLLSAWNLFAPAPFPPASNQSAYDVSQEFENTLLADVEQDSEYIR
jgi:hypothetical protein